MKFIHNIRKIKFTRTIKFDLENILGGAIIAAGTGLLATVCELFYEIDHDPFSLLLTKLFLGIGVSSFLLSFILCFKLKKN